MMIDFSAAAQQVMQFAHQEAQRQNSHVMGAEHLLLSIARCGGATGELLTANGFDLKQVREFVVQQSPKLAAFSPPILPKTPGLDRAMHNAAEEMAKAHATGLDVPHILLGVLRELDSYAASILALFDVDAVRRGAELMVKRQPTLPETTTLETPEADSTRKVRKLTVGPSTFRILDASANRAAEGLRVVEDYVRFVLDDARLTAKVKSLRHRLAAAVALLERERLLAARDTAGDVGVDLKEAAELQRGDVAEVAAASLQRAEQALRSLGEFGKLVSGEAAAQFEAIRYAVYQLESLIAARGDRSRRIAAARLYVLVDGGALTAAFVALVEQLIAGGVDVIQLRDKRLADRELVERGRLLRRTIAAASSTALFIMNDRPDLAVLSGADGVHVGQDELSAADARKIVGPSRLVGVSTHDAQQADQAAAAGADYIGVGPTFPSSTKQFDAFPGLELSRYAAANLALPAFAIGGITLDNLPQVLATGIHRVAMAGAISQAADVPAELAKWRAALG